MIRKTTCPHGRCEANERIRVFERQLSDDGAVIVKFFLHIDKKEQSRRFRKLRKDPAYAWKVGKDERRRHKLYSQYAGAVEDMLRETSTPCAPWAIVPATDDRFARVTVAETLAAAFERALTTRKPHPAAKKGRPAAYESAGPGGPHGRSRREAVRRTDGGAPARTSPAPAPLLPRTRSRDDCL